MLLPRSYVPATPVGARVTPSCMETRFQVSRERVISFRGSVLQSACSPWGRPLPVPSEEEELQTERPVLAFCVDCAFLSKA